MSDDQRPSRRDPDDFSEFGSLFEDTPPTENIEQVSPQSPEPIDDGWGQRTNEHQEVPSDDRPLAAPDPYEGYDHGAGYEGLADGADREDEPRPDHVQDSNDDSGAISFGDSDTGPLPHWTEPPTGEVPRFVAKEQPNDAPLEDDQDVDVWSTFSSESPVWKDEQPDEEPAPGGPAAEAAELATQEQTTVSGRQARVSGPQEQVSGQHEAEQPNRIMIGTDPSGMPRREPAPDRGSRRRRPERPSGAKPPTGGGGDERDMPTAIAVGMLLGALFIAALITDRRLVVALVTIVLGLGAVEFFGRVTEKGYRPAIVPGVVACVSAPLATYWMGDIALPLVIAFGFMASSVSFAGAHSVESGPLPNASVTTVGMVWIGLLGAFAMLILRFSTANESGLAFSDNWGTDTLFLLALGVVANDVGALAAGSVAGRTPLRPWISPNKTVEGLIGGSFLTIIVLVLVGITGLSETWSSSFHLLLLALVISLTAPMGDLVESMFKRNLDVKDFGALVRGHGGVLDRFDGFLFALPAVYYLTEILQPWNQFSG